MGTWPGCIILSILLLVATNGAVSSEELPYWHHNPKLLKQIESQRRIVFSVKREREQGEHKLRVLGAGVVNAPLSFVMEQMLRFEELEKVSSHFAKVEHRPHKKEVYFFIKALGTQVRFIIRYQLGVLKSKTGQMDWEVIWGPLRGMRGNYQLRRITPQKTEVSVWAIMKKKELPLPAFLYHFTLEVIAEKVAQKMRAYIERNYKQIKKVQENHGRRQGRKRET